MNTGIQRENPAFTGIHNPPSTVRSALEPLAVPSGDVCPAQFPVAATLRQYWYCERPSGHDGPHEVYAPNVKVRARSGGAL
jgi:hypothetical protein